MATPEIIFYTAKVRTACVVLFNEVDVVALWNLQDLPVCSTG